MKVGKVEVSRFILGGNPFSGFSHQSREMDVKMMHYFTAERIKATLREAEGLGITTVLARADLHIIRVLMEYWDEGGKLKWLAQTCPGVGPSRMCVEHAVNGGASGCHIHGGVMDHLVAQDQVEDAMDGVKAIHDAGLPAGVAGHNVRVFEWAEKHLDVDYYMCCYYNPTVRDDDPTHDARKSERFDDEDRARMVEMIGRLSKPVIHYKVLAAGRNDPSAGFDFAARHMRGGDAVCVGIYDEGRPGMLGEDVRLFEKRCAAEGGCGTGRAKGHGCTKG